MIKKDNYYYQFVKKYWFYKKSKSKKISTNIYYIAVILFFVSLLDFRVGNQSYDINKSNKTILLIDSSLSMRANDVRPTRISKASEFASLFLNSHKESLYSLIAFSDFSKILVPFTFDKEIIRSHLNILNDVNLFRGGSNLFLSINKGISYLKKNSLNDQLNGNILVLTDGDIHDYNNKFTIPSGVKIASINFSSFLGGAVPSFDLDGNYKEPLLHRGKRVHSRVNERLFKKLENDFVNFKYWNWKPGISLENKISEFFGTKKNEKISKKNNKEFFLTLRIAALAILILSLSFLLSRFKSFNKSFIWIIGIFISHGFNPDAKANDKLERFLYSKIKSGSSSRIERLKLAEIYLKNDLFKMSKSLYEENLLEDYNREEFGNYFNYGTLLIKMGLFREGVEIFNKIKDTFRNDKKYKELEKKINSNILIVISNKKNKLKMKKNVKYTQKNKKRDENKINRRKFVNELKQPVNNRSIFKDQIVNHALSQDRKIQRSKMILNIYKNKTDWEHKGW